MKLFDNHVDIEIILEKGLNEAIRLAAIDLQNNLHRLSGKSGAFPITENSSSKRAIYIRTVAGGDPETYTVCVEQEQVVITGSDTLGTVFGIYAFATKCLGILPVYRLIDRFPTKQEALYLKECNFSSGVHPIRFRGWFLNDEDLLTDFHDGGGRRNIDYPFYQNVIAPDVLDMILETALRMEINLVIPSSFVDISNPDEEKLVQAVTRRGLYISQHHVEPIGASYFAADAYMKKYGKEGERVSFINNRERMEEIWRYYAKKWAKYGEQVVWQLGLRGKADQAVWKSDPNVPMDARGRGAIISDAIATQYRIVSEVTGTKHFHSTATLWLEGAELYGKGYLQIPENTAVVFSDIGYSQMFGDDFYRIERKPDRHYGVYYHVGYWAQGPHLSEGCDLRKMEFSYREACKQRSLYYSILNVSNVRPLHFSAWYNAELMKDPETFDGKQTVDQLLISLFGTDAATVKDLMEAYYDTIADLGKEELQAWCEGRDFYYHDYGKLNYPEFPATDGVLHYKGRNYLNGEKYIANEKNFTEVLQASLPKWERLYERMQAAEAMLSDSNRLYFNQFLKFETFYMMQLTRWLVSCIKWKRLTDEKEWAEEKTVAVDALHSILEERKILEQGEWRNWHRGDRKIGISDLIELTEKTYRNRTEE